MFLKNPGRRLAKVLKKQEKEEGKRRTKKDETMDCQMWRCKAGLSVCAVGCRSRPIAEWNRREPVCAQ